MIGVIIQCVAVVLYVGVLGMLIATWIAYALKDN